MLNEKAAGHIKSMNETTVLLEFDGEESTFVRLCRQHVLEIDDNKHKYSYASE